VIVHKTDHHLIADFRDGNVASVLGNLIGTAGIGKHHADKAGGIVQLPVKAHRNAALSLRISIADDCAICG